MLPAHPSVAAGINVASGIRILDLEDDGTALRPPTNRQAPTCPPGLERLAARASS